MRRCRLDAASAVSHEIRRGGNMTYTDLPLIRLIAISFVSHRHHLCLSHSDTINVLSRGSDSKGWACVWEWNLRPSPPRFLSRVSIV